MPLPLKRRTISDVMQLTEDLFSPHATIEGSSVTGCPTWYWSGFVDAKNVDRARWLQVVGYAADAPDRDADNLDSFDLEIDPADPTHVRYFYWRKGWVSMPMEQAAIYAMRMPAVLAAISDLLEMPQALRKPTPVIADVLWLVGSKRVGTQLIPVYLARAYDRQRKAILTELMDRQYPEFGLILTTGRLPIRVDPFAPLPRQLKVVTLVDVLADQEQAEIDNEKLGRLLTGPSATIIPQAEPIHFDPLTQTLTLAGVAKPWVLHGEKQAKAISYLANEIKKGRDSISAAELVSASESRSLSVQRLFEGGPWRDYLHSPCRGQWTFFCH